MPRPSSLTLAKDAIFSAFARAQHKAYSEAELNGVLLENRAAWELAESTKATDFIRFLTEQGELKSHRFQSEQYGRTITRYSWGKASPLELALSIKSRGYLCHATAATLHGLIKHSSATIYLNAEQTAKPSSSGQLMQQSIDRAFSNQQRRSNLTYKSGRLSVTMLAGKNTNGLGVEEMAGPVGEHLRVTNLERTLIDMVVRPAYSGGLPHVFKAFRAAKTRVSVSRLLATLSELDYVYPYHQAIGYLMEKTGHPETSYAKLRALGLDYDFYLVHGMEEPDYSKEWRLFHPRPRTS